MTPDVHCGIILTPRGQNRGLNYTSQIPAYHGKDNQAPSQEVERPNRRPRDGKPEIPKNLGWQWLPTIFVGTAPCTFRLTNFQPNSIKEIVIISWEEAKLQADGIDAGTMMAEGFVLCAIHWKRDWGAGTTWTYWR